MKRYFNIMSLLLLSILLLNSCNEDITTSESSFEWIPTHTIGGFINEFSSDIGDYPTRNALFTVDSIPRNKVIVISGVVISNDDEGNIYKNLIIRDFISNKAIKISVDAGNLSSIFPTGRSIVLSCSGLAIGKYAGMLQLGIPYYNTESGKIGFEIGRIPYTLFMTRVQISKIATVPKSQLVDTVTIAQILSGGAGMFSKLVCIKNAYFTGKGANSGVPAILKTDAEYIFAPSTNGVGYPQSREIQDGTGSIFVSTSEYSKFANLKLPSSTYVGNITALVGWYNDKDVVISSSKIYHQLTLRSINDLGKGFEKYIQYQQ
ncbi:MAG: DUF5689 domain-containing protein [Paludibacter sp.]